MIADDDPARLAAAGFGSDATTQAACNTHQYSEIAVGAACRIAQAALVDASEPCAAHSAAALRRAAALAQTALVAFSDAPLPSSYLLLIPA